MILSQLVYLGIGLIGGWLLKWIIDENLFATPKKLISNNEAMALILNFQKDNPGVHSGHLEWNDFNNYLKFIKKKVKSSGMKISGLEYYFGRYGENDAEQPNQQTIVLFPTYEGVVEDSQNQKVKGHIPFDPENTSRMGRNISIREIYRSIPKEIDLENARIENGFGDSTLAYNRSQMSPPRPPNTL